MSGPESNSANGELINRLLSSITGLIKTRVYYTLFAWCNLKLVYFVTILRPKNNNNPTKHWAIFLFANSCMWSNRVTLIFECFPSCQCTVPLPLSSMFVRSCSVWKFSRICEQLFSEGKVLPYRTIIHQLTQRSNTENPPHHHTFRGQSESHCLQDTGTSALCLLFIFYVWPIDM